ncbi:MAG: hypothetical protein H5T99_13085, partial [Moorella sp. (in: Bacteria)]|nr:hypothetical protein [Moorella sp. (in: firmicutes)]
MHRVKVVTDSTGYLPGDVLAEYGDILEIVPLKVHFPGVTLADYPAKAFSTPLACSRLGQEVIIKGNKYPSQFRGPVQQIGIR